MDEDLYEALEVSPRASDEVVRAAYRRLARAYHPDGATPDAEKMVRLNLAFEVLSHPDKRAAYDRDRASGNAGQSRGMPAGPDAAPAGEASRPAGVSSIPPLEYFDPPETRERALLWGAGTLALLVLMGGLVIGATLLRGRDPVASSDAPVEDAPAASTPVTLEAPAGVGAGAPAAAAAPAGVRVVARDLGAIASDLPGTALPLGSAVQSVVDQNTKPRDVFAVSLLAGQEVRFVLTDLASPISAWLEISLLNPGARDLADPRSFTQALVRTTYRGDEWRFTPAVAGTYHLVIRSRTSGQSYAFTLAAAR